MKFLKTATDDMPQDYTKGTWPKVRYKAKGKDDAKYDGMTVDEYLIERIKEILKTEDDDKIPMKVFTLLIDRKEEDLNTNHYDIFIGCRRSLKALTFGVQIEERIVDKELLEELRDRIAKRAKEHFTREPPGRRTSTNILLLLHHFDREKVVRYGNGEVVIPNRFDQPITLNTEQLEANDFQRILDFIDKAKDSVTLSGVFDRRIRPIFSHAGVANGAIDRFKTQLVNVVSDPATAVDIIRDAAALADQTITAHARHGFTHDAWGPGVLLGEAFLRTLLQEDLPILVEHDRTNLEFLMETLLEEGTHIDSDIGRPHGELEKGEDFLRVIHHDHGVITMEEFKDTFRGRENDIDALWKHLVEEKKYINNKGFISTQFRRVYWKKLPLELDPSYSYLEDDIKQILSISFEKSWGYLINKTVGNAQMELDAANGQTRDNASEVRTLDRSENLEFIET